MEQLNEGQIRRAGELTSRPKLKEEVVPGLLFLQL